jgi:hypothetical protein
MIDAVDRELRERFALLADPTDDSGWREVRARVRPQARTVVAIAAALVLGAVVAASAAGVPSRIVRLFDSAQPAPPAVVRSFTDFDQIVSADLAAPPRQVLELPEATLWVAPTTTGGYCSLVKLPLPNGTSEGAGGECAPRPETLAVDVSLHGPFSPNGEVLGGPVLVRGVVGQSKASALELEFEDGDTVSVPLVWVPDPLSTGFFVYAVPRPHWLAGHRPTRLTVYAADGHELAHAAVHGFPLSP